MRHVLSSLSVLLLAGSLLAGPGEAVAAAVLSARTLSPDVAQHSRYLWTGTVPPKERPAFVQVLAGQLNQLSTQADLVVPEVVPGDLVRLDLRDYGFDPRTWEKTADVDPYFHVRIRTRVTRTVTSTRDGVPCTWDAHTLSWRPTFAADGTTRLLPEGKVLVEKTQTASAPWLPAPAIAELITRTQSQSPLLRADWFLAQVSRQLSPDNEQTGIGYYDWLRLKSRDDLFRLIVFDQKKSQQIQRELRAALDHSGVSQQNRQIVRFQALTGGLWITLDSKSNVGRGNAIRNLRAGDYDHQAEEIYGVLPNGLPVYWAGTDRGERQDSAPDFVGPDDSPTRIGRDGRIHVCLACVRCHGGGVLQPVKDWARATYTAGSPVLLASPDYRVFQELRRQYLSDLDTQLELDRLSYTLAFRRATGGLTPAAFSSGLASVWNAYVERPVTLEGAAFEWGVPPARLRVALRGVLVYTGQVDSVLSAYLLEPPRAVRRSHYEEVQPLLGTYLQHFLP